jgi:muramoyltetrapeptide carboxypeptidase LdcA involved in peptidoglycan recycling
MRGCDDPGGAVTARQVVERLTGDVRGPVIFGFPSGHTTGPCWTLPLGVSVRVSTRPQPVVVVEEAAVR